MRIHFSLSQFSLSIHFYHFITFHFSLCHFTRDSPKQIKLGSDVMIKDYKSDLQQVLYFSSLCLRLTISRYKTKIRIGDSQGGFWLFGVKKKRLRSKSVYLIHRPWFKNCSMFEPGSALIYPEISRPMRPHNFLLCAFTAKKSIPNQCQICILTNN